MPRKRQTPPAPAIIADVERARSVSVIPNESTKVVIKYLDLEDQISTITASKINHQWSLNKSGSRHHYRTKFRKSGNKLSSNTTRK